ncbi:hypothetical protein F5B21DRAFT_519580 [Xylaria acuta]|nr:hypothetical protein F5B21DRAFT_519580 [Xylaria acuta]
MATAPQETQSQPSSRSGEFPCQECGKVLSRRDALLRHTRTAHGSGQHFWCQEDGCLEARKGYRRFHDFRKHMRLAHNKTVSADDIASQQVLRGNRHTARENETRAMPPVVPQAAPQATLQAPTQLTPQPTPLAIPRATLQAIPRAVPRVIAGPLGHTVSEQPRPCPVYVPDYTMYGGRPEPTFRKSNILAPPQVFPTYIPDYVREGRRPEIMFKKSEMLRPPVNRNPTTPYEARAERTVQSIVAAVKNEAANNYYMGYGEEERRGLIRTVDSQAFMYKELLYKYNKLQEERDGLVSTLQNLLNEKLERPNLEHQIGDPQN